MQRRHFLRHLSFVSTLAIPFTAQPVFSANAKQNAKQLEKTWQKLKNPKAVWKKLLDKQRYAVLFEEATEPSGSSPLNHEKRAGTFICAACHLPLFASTARYESGTGWPSFFQPIQAANIGTKTDYKIIIPRTEYHCARCGGHQGHVFKDGPKPTGLRYCNNGLALRFIPQGSVLPALRN